MKVLMFTSLIERVGTWYRAFNLAAGLAKKGHSVMLVKGGVQRYVPRATRESGVEVWDFPRFFGSSLFHRGTRMPWDIALRSVFAAAKRCDVIHSFTHHLNSLLPTLLAGRAARTPVVMGDRDDLWADGGLYDHGRTVLDRMDMTFHNLTERGMGRWLDALTVASDDLMARAYATGAARGCVRKIINGCPVDRIRPGDTTAARAELGIDHGRPMLLFVGVGQYDVDLIFDSVRLLRGMLSPHAAFPVVYLVGPNAPSLLERAARQGLANDVVATGFLPDARIVRYLQAADIGLLPFADKPLNRARFPIKLGDYLAAGLPVLTNRVGEMGRIVEAERAGVATASDPDAFARGLAEMLGDRTALARYRSNARAAAERMSWEAVSGELEAFYQDLYATKVGARARMTQEVRA
jgi:glycosyltransferase involved in cell wall biosynthesis